MQRSHASIIIGAAFGMLTACSPAAQNVGNGLDADTDADVDTGTESGEESGADGSGGIGGGEVVDPGPPVWSLVLPQDHARIQLAAMPDGGVAVAVRLTNADADTVIRHYAADGSMTWETPIDARLDDIEALPDGRVIVAAVVGAQSGLWRLSPSGNVELSVLLPPAEGTEVGVPHIDEIAVSSSGVAYLAEYNGELGIHLGWADLDFDPQWSWSSFGFVPDSLAVLPSGEIQVLTGAEELPEGAERVVHRFSADGISLGVEGRPRGLFADDAPLVQVGISDEGVWAQGLDGTSDLMSLFPRTDFDFADEMPVSTFRQGLGIAATLEDGSFAALQIGPGPDTRETIVQQPCTSSADPQDIALAPDGSMFVAGYCEDEIGPGDSRLFLLMLPPL